MFCCVVSLSILRVVPYFGEPVGRVKIQTTSKNTQRYYTTKRLIRGLLSNTPKFYVGVDEFRWYLFKGNAWQKYAKRNGIGKEIEIQLTDWSAANKPV